MILDWLVANWEHLAAGFGMLVALSTAIAGLTPTKKDDKFLAKVVKWADVFSIVFTKKDAQVIADAIKKESK